MGDRLDARSSPLEFTQSLVAWIRVYVLVDAGEDYIPGFKEVALGLGRLFSKDESPVSFECATGCRTMYSEKRVFTLPAYGAFVFLRKFVVALILSLVTSCASNRLLHMSSSSGSNGRTGELNTSKAKL